VLYHYTPDLQPALNATLPLYTTLYLATSKTYSHPPTQLLKNPLIHCHFIVFIALNLSIAL